MADDDNNLLIWQFLSVSQQRQRQTFLCVSLATVPQHFCSHGLQCQSQALLYCALIVAVVLCDIRSSTGRQRARHGEKLYNPFHINSPQGSHGAEIWTSANRQTLLSAVPCLSALNNSGGSLQKCLTHVTRTWVFHQRPADPQWPAPSTHAVLLLLLNDSQPFGGS